MTNPITRAYRRWRVQRELARQLPIIFYHVPTRAAVRLAYVQFKLAKERHA